MSEAAGLLVLGALTTLIGGYPFFRTAICYRQALCKL